MFFFKMKDVSLATNGAPRLISNNCCVRLVTSKLLFLIQQLDLLWTGKKQMLLSKKDKLLN
jgi:hypothetical protein